MPQIRENIEKYFEKAPLSGIDPAEVIACGAALHSKAYLSGDEILGRFDITTMSLGVEIAGGGFSVVLPRNSIYPRQRAVVRHQNPTIFLGNKCFIGLYNCRR